MTEAALQTACLVAHRFVVITLPPRTIAHSDRVVRALGLEHRCTVTAVDVRSPNWSRAPPTCSTRSPMRPAPIDTEHAEAVVLAAPDWPISSAR